MALFHPMHLAIVALVVVLVLGPRKLPELARGIGEAMQAFKGTLHAGDSDPSAARRGSGEAGRGAMPGAPGVETGGPAPVLADAVFNRKG